MTWRRAIPLGPLLALVLSGCLGADTGTTGADAGGQAGAAARHPFLNGTYAWHFDPFGPVSEQFVVGPLGLASQAVAHPCLLNGEPYFYNLHLTPDGPPGPVLNGTTDLAVLLHWTDQDYSNDELWLAFRPNGTRQYHVAGPITRGEESLVPIEPAWWGTGRHPTITWDLWLCLATEGTDPSRAGYEPRVFVGSVAVQIELVLDPGLAADAS